MKNNKVFMAIKVGKESVEWSFKMYKGIAALKILAVNPNREQLSELTGRTIEDEPEYVTKNDEGKETVKITFYAKTDPEAPINGGIEIPVSFTFMLTKDYRFGQTSGKYQIVDKYGRFAWATKETIKAKEIPMYEKGPANISKEYRPAYIGEEALIEFLGKWLNVSGPANYKDGKWVDKENIEDSELFLDMDALFKGNVSELRQYVELAKAYLVKAAIGVRTVETDKGTRQYHAVYTRMFLKNAVKNYSALDADIASSQSNGGSPTTEWSTQPLHENTVEATDLKQDKDNDPIGEATASATPWD